MSVDELIGRNIQSYAVEARLGTGGMGAVYLATDKRLNRKVALKILLVATTDAKRRFLEEGQVIARLEHRHICRIFHAGEDQGLMFIAMEYIDGRTLAEAAKGGVQVDDAVRICAEICDALHYAHELGYVHRDVTTNNIMLRRDSSEAVLMDFGLARNRATTRVTEEGARLGTPQYMSPEQVRGADTTSSTDIWSMGVVLYEILTGQLPFAADYADSIENKILNVEPEAIRKLRPDVPSEVADAVTACLHKNPRDRHRSVEDLRSALLIRRSAAGSRPESILNVDARVESIIDYFLPSSQPALRDALRDRDTVICSFVSVSPTRSEPIRNSSMCHHLGHLFFADLFRAILDMHGSAAVLICPSSAYYKDVAPFNRMIYDTMGNWQHCFNFVVRCEAVHHLIYNQELDSIYDDVARWLLEMERQLLKLGRAVREEIADWRWTGKTDEKTEDLLRGLFGVGDIPSEQEYALAYMLVERPRWYSQDWFLRAVKSFVSKDDGLPQRLFSSRKFLIVEADKNKTSWEPMELCARRWNLGQLAPRAYFKSLPGVSGARAMRSGDINNAVFLYEDVGSVIAKHDHGDLLRIIQHFDPSTTTSSLEETLAALLARGAASLRQSEPRHGETK